MSAYRRTAGVPLDPSGAPEADRDVPTIHDDGDLSDAVGELQHALQVVLILFDVEVVEGNLPGRVVLPGTLGERSVFLAEYQDLLGHEGISPWLFTRLPPNPRILPIGRSIRP